MGDKQGFAFNRMNFILLAIGMAAVILGFILVTEPSSPETVFQTNIFSVRRIKMAPAICSLNFILTICDVMRRPKTKE